MKFLLTPFLVLTLFATPLFVCGQENKPSTPTEEEQQKEKADKEKKAFALLEQVVEEAQMLRLPENRARIQIGAADMLWKRDQGRARSLFALAADSIAEMMRPGATNAGLEERRRGPNQNGSAFQLRQELVLTVAKYDAPLAYQLLAATKPTTLSTDGRNQGFGSEDNLEQRLLAEIAALDPKLALQNAEQMLDKGQYARSLTELLVQLQAKDKEAAARLEDKIVKRLQSANMLSSVDAGNLALGLLRPGPRVVANSASGAAATPNNSGQVLAPSSYSALLSSVIDAALRATPQPAGSRNQGRVRGQSSGPIVRSGEGRVVNTANETTAAEFEQMNARRLLGGLQSLLPQIDQYTPSRSQAVRQKMTDLRMGDAARTGGQSQFRVGPQTTSEGLMTMATQVPPQVQPRIYQQAAMRALEEGNPDRARQIANDHLEAAARDSVLQAVEFRQTSEKLGGNSLDEVRQTLSGLRSDHERIDLLLRLSSSAVAANRPLAVQLLDEARLYSNRRASNYQQIEQQLRLAGAYKDLEPSRGFEVLEPVVVQLNELLSAAQTLSGFEINVFRDGELPMEARSGLSAMMSSFGQVLGRLAQSDFDRSQILANRFQLTEPRLIARLGIVRGMLGLERGPRRANFAPRRFDF
ncbi:MAG TPA: hypothetical protein VFH31_14755 [Pyrinomonadaceae bacterium]|nr:hypothetical protein [Pyrinomonadaceae bacterium]